MTDADQTRTHSDHADGRTGDPSAGPDGSGNGFGFGAGAPFRADQAERARAAYVRWNRRVAAVRAQPTWVQKLAGYLALAAVAGLVVVLGLIALIVGLILTLPIILLMLVNRLIVAVKGGGAASPRGRDQGRANVRVITRRG